jgi:hypothetical protein
MQLEIALVPNEGMEVLTITRGGVSVIYISDASIRSN